MTYENYKDIDIAEGTFVKKWPNWLRWILFIPSSILGSLIFTIIWGIINKIITRNPGYPLDNWYSTSIDLIQSFMIGALFVYIGSLVIPKWQFITSIILLLACIIFAVISFNANLYVQVSSVWMFALHSILVIAGGVYSVLKIKKKTI